MLVTSKSMNVTHFSATHAVVNKEKSKIILPSLKSSTSCMSRCILSLLSNKMHVSVTYIVVLVAQHVSVLWHYLQWVVAIFVLNTKRLVVHDMVTATTWL
jgi:uncharacterized oligopeptide transporter (OPT) family protein